LVRYAYIHGFASGPLSAKGLYLAESFAASGITMLLPDLNVPTFATMTFSSILDELDRIHAWEGGETVWRLVGSSLGGYISARWASLHPNRVDRLVLLCPGLDLRSRWEEILGVDEVRLWKLRGFHEVADGSGELQPLSWKIVEDAANHPSYPEVPCPTRIIHGNLDTIVPLELSRRYLEMNLQRRSPAEMELVEVDDDHSLENCRPQVAELAREWLG
jgi:pimeloyl-ACP methyl ester carboxylesterase